MCYIPFVLIVGFSSSRPVWKCESAPRLFRPIQVAVEIRASLTGFPQRRHFPQATHLPVSTHRFCRGPKLSNDKQFVEKLEDVVGLYLNPPENAIVLSCDEKSQMQALDPTQPGLPLKKGRCGTLTHDYKRNGTTTMFAALNTLDGSIIGTCMPKHRHQEWIRFLNQIKRSVPKDKQIHIICDNYATHKHQKVVNWLKRNTRFHVHFTPTSASWLNMVERFFRDLSEQRLRRGVFHSVPELIQAVEEYVGGHNQNPKPFIWTATASDILEKVQRARKKLDKLQSV